MKQLIRLPLWATYALIAYMPFHIFIAYSLGQFNGSLNAWKIGKDIATIALLLLTSALVIINGKLGKIKHLQAVILLAGVYAMLHAVTYLANKSTDLDIAALASTYNNRFIWIFLIAAGSVLLLKNKPNTDTIIKIVLIASTIVCLLGLAQWFLPSDILTNFGYSKELGAKPNFFINEDPAFPRVMSTIRDPNSLGAFLIVPILLLVQKLTNAKSKNRTLFTGALLLHLLIMYLTFSRASWLGLIIALTTLFVITHKQKTVEFIKRFWPVLAIGLLLVVSVGYTARETKLFRSIILRADDTNSPSELDSDEYHLQFIKQGIEGVIDKPLGHGPGTAGIVSIQSENKVNLTENYYIQIAYEVGIVGLGIFIAIWALVTKALVKVKSNLSLVLIASAAAYAVMAIFMHLWTNEAVAYTWWGLAGFAIYTIKKYVPIKQIFRSRF